MADAGFYRGTNTEQDSRFGDKQKIMMQKLKFSENLKEKVSFSKINIDVIKPWINSKITELLGFEDEVVSDYVVTQLETTTDPKEIQLNLTGFLNAKLARVFLEELWDLLLSAQNNAEGIPEQLIEAKKEEIRKRQSLEEEIQRKIKLEKQRFLSNSASNNNRCSQMQIASLPASLNSSSLNNNFDRQNYRHHHHHAINQDSNRSRSPHNNQHLHHQKHHGEISDSAHRNIRIDRTDNRKFEENQRQTMKHKIREIRGQEIIEDRQRKHRHKKTKRSDLDNMEEDEKECEVKHAKMEKEKLRDEKYESSKRIKKTKKKHSDHHKSSKNSMKRQRSNSGSVSDETDNDKAKSREKSQKSHHRHHRHHYHHRHDEKQSHSRSPESPDLQISHANLTNSNRNLQESFPAEIKAAHYQDDEKIERHKKQNNAEISDPE